jgi:hypothetical protein
VKWCFDTSALIEPWVRLYPPDIFGPVWTRLTELGEEGMIVSPQDVLLELARQKDDLHSWAEARPTMFLSPDRSVMEAFTAIVNDHPNFMKAGSTKSGADPFVVALAEVNGLTVVTYETKAKKDAMAPKMPDVCTARGVGCVQLVDVLRAVGFRM